MKNWCERRPISFMAAFLICYLAAFYALEHVSSGTMVWVHCALDDKIPFCKYAIVPYCLWFLWIPFTLLYFMRRVPRAEFSRLCLTLFGGMAVSLLIYAFVPTALKLRPTTVSGSDIFARAVRLLYAIDTPTNVCPSIHVFNSVTVTLAYWRSPHFARENRGWMRWAAAVLCVSIMISTVLLRQHSVIDVLAGVFMALIFDLMAEARQKAKRYAPRSIR